MTNETPESKPTKSPWTIPLHRAVDVNGAARILGEFMTNDSESYSAPELDQTFSVVQNWRDSESVPILVGIETAPNPVV